LLVNKEEKKK